MRLNGVLALGLAVAPSACMCGAPMEPFGQFGPYHEHNQQIVLQDGTAFTVYRVKHWTFKDGSPPALQLEYASPVPVADTAGVRRTAERIWPAFAQYVEARHLDNAIVTATNLELTGHPGAWFARTHHFGLIAERDSAGRWHFQGHDETLAPPDTSGASGIVEADGKPLKSAPKIPTS